MLFFKKAPGFWGKQSVMSSMAPDLLIPFSVIYYMASLWQRSRVKQQSVTKPVICIGNSVLGGAGKTPTAIAIAQLLLAQGKKIAFISRGYGGNITEPTKVDTTVHTSNEVGDEPLLLAAIAPTWVGEHKVALAEAAIKDGAEIIIMDDGMQNFSLKKDVQFLVIDGDYGLGNGMVFPAGPLREPLLKTLERATSVILIGDDKTGDVTPAADGYRPILAADIIANVPDETSVRAYLPFAGIGRPEKFFNMLLQLNLNLVDTVSFPDHHPYDTTEMQQLIERANVLGARLITTQKDFVRIPEAFRESVSVLPIRIQFQNPDAVLAQLKPIL